MKIRELVLRECGFVQGWYGLSYLEQRIVEPVIAQALSLLTREATCAPRPFTSTRILR